MLKIATSEPPSPSARKRWPAATKASANDESPWTRVPGGKAPSSGAAVAGVDDADTGMIATTAVKTMRRRLILTRTATSTLAAAHPAEQTNGLVTAARTAGAPPSRIA